MLCLTLKQNERVQIGEAVVVFRGGGGSFARIGIEAPPHIEILRESAKCRERKKELRTND